MTKPEQIALLTHVLKSFGADWELYEDQYFDLKRLLAALEAELIGTP